MQKSLRAPLLVFCLLVASLLSVMFSPMMTQITTLEESVDDIQYSSPIQATISPSSGWTTGGEEITITGSGFTDLAFSNTTNDGINHQWVETTMDYTDEAGRFNSIVMDSNGHIHVVHINGGNYQIRHSVYDGTSWNSVKIKDCGQTYCWDIHMVIDDNDHIHLAYTTYTQWDETLVYMNYDGTTWTDTLVSSSAHFGPIGIAVDSNNHPHISYAVDGADQCGNGLRLASYTGTAWSHDTVEAGNNRGCESAIVIDDNDNIYIAYQDRSDSKLKIATDKSGSWDSYLVDTGSSPGDIHPGYMTSMAMDQQGQFHIAHFDEKEDDLRYSTGVPNGQWTTTIVDSAGHTGRDPSIALDAADNPHIVYRSWNGWSLKYATIDPSTSNWTVSTISGTNDVGDGNSLFIDQDGIMHVPFSDDTDEVLKYATKSTGLSQTNEIRVQFGQYGSVTGTVVNDTTIRVTTPSLTTGDSVAISIWDKDENQHQLSSTFQFIDQNDLDSDGVPNVNDDCPEVIGNSTQDANGCPDADGDGYSNTGDAFPNDANDWMDSDDDGVGDNSDAFPNDASETLDSDGDGVGDNGDLFPGDGNETVDSDDDGVGDNADAFPEDANETLDTDGDGVGDNADVFPYNAIEAFDSDGDGVGDNTDAFPNDGNETIDSDGDGVGDNADIFPNDSNESIDSDGDGIGDNTDEFPFTDNLLDSDGDGYLDSEDEFSEEATQWNDTDGDGYGDNWGNSDWNESRMSEGMGVFIEGALLSDYCPEVNGNSTGDGYVGCLDADGNGIADIFEQNETNQTNDTNQTNGTVADLDSDGDGVLDVDDACPGTTVGTQVDNLGCKVVDTQNDESDSIIDSFMSGSSGTITTTVGIGAIMIALFSLLQTNLVAALLPDAFRWVQVLRKNSTLSKEEVNELTYLQSLVQAYYNNPSELYEELEEMKSDLTARYTNNEVKKETREKLLTLINELQNSNPDELKRIANNEAYFGLSGTIDSKQRTELLEEKVAMRDNIQSFEPMDTGSPQVQEIPLSAPPLDATGVIKADGYEWYEWPESSGSWWYRTAYTQDQWQYWQQ